MLHYKLLFLVCALLYCAGDQFQDECGLETIASTPLVRAGLGGVKAKQFPWHVAIFHREKNNQFEQACGGSLVRSNLVISAAHCFSDRAHSHQVRVADYRIVGGVRLSSWNSTEIGRQQSEVREVRLGQEYGASIRNYQDDISIIQLTTRFTFSDTVRAVCLDLTDTDQYTSQTSPGTVGKVAGWGLTESGAPSDSLNFLGIPVVAREKCLDTLPYGYKAFFTSDKICAGLTNGTAVCQGDSGGGLVFPLQNISAGTQRWILRGVLSNAPSSRNLSNLCLANFALYTNIYSHRMWLTTQIDENLPRGYVNEDGSEFTGLLPPPGAAPETPVFYPQPTRLLKNCSHTDTTIFTEGLVCQGMLLFEDVFDLNPLDRVLWKTEHKIARGPDYPFVVYMDNPTNVYVKDGKLFIVPDLLENQLGKGSIRTPLELGERCTGKSSSHHLDLNECSSSQFFISPPIISGKVHSAKRFSFRYGRVEVIAKMPKGDWIYPEILLEPTDQSTYGSEDYASGVIRIAVTKGNLENSKILRGGLVLGSQEPLRSAWQRQTNGSSPWSDGFVNFTLVWKPDSIALYANGNLYAFISPPVGGFAREATNLQPAAVNWKKGTSLAPFDQFFHISLAVNVGGIHEFPDSNKKPWINASVKNQRTFWQARDQWYSTWQGESSGLQVDSVRIYAL